MKPPKPATTLAQRLAESKAARLKGREKLAAAAGPPVQAEPDPHPWSGRLKKGGAK